MRAKLKGLHSPDVELDSFWPAEPDDFGIYIEAYIGPEDAEGAESFGITVCTPKWLNRQLASDGYQWGWHHLVLPEYDKRLIEAAITRYAERSMAATWPDVARKLARIGQWEFEDYDP